MARSLQDRYCQHEAAEAAAKRQTAKDGKERLIYADALGYWYMVPGPAKPPRAEPNEKT